MRGLVRDGRLIQLSVELPDKPGALARFADKIAEFGGNIVEVQHQRLFGALSVNVAEVDMLIEADEAHGAAIVAGLESARHEGGRRSVSTAP